MQLSRMSPPLLQYSLLQIAMLMSQNRIDNELLRLQKFVPGELLYLRFVLFLDHPYQPEIQTTG